MSEKVHIEVVQCESTGKISIYLDNHRITKHNTKPITAVTIVNALVEKRDILEALEVL